MIKPHRLPGSSSLRSAALLLAVISVMYLARDILIPLALAMTLALILSPAVSGLQKIRLGRVPAVALVMVVTIAATGGIGWVIFNQLLEVTSELPLYRDNIHTKVEALRAPGKGALGRATASVKELGKELAATEAPAAPPVAGDRGRRNTPNQATRPLAVQVVEAPANELAYAREVVKPFLGPVGEFGIVLIFSIFLLINQNDLRDRLFRLAGLSQLNVMTLALDDATRRVSRYLVMQFAVNLCFGLVVGVGLYLIGVPYAALWGSVAGILRIVPYVGAVVSGLLPITLALAVFDHWTPPLLVFLLFATLELVTGNFLEPWLYGAHTGISALALLLTTVFWTVLWGPAGLILSTPLTVCVVVLGRYVPQFSFLHILLGDEDVLAVEARVYQRLLAMDHQEARAAAELYLNENSLSQLYDSVIIPALTLAEQDRHKGALDPVREEFLFLSVKEMIGELSERAVKSEEGDADIAAGEPPMHPPAQASAGRILILPASDQADELAGAMLGQLVEQSGQAAIAFSFDHSLQQTLSFIEPTEKDTFCISALPPFAFSRAIALSRQLRLRFPRTRLMIGVWGFTGDTERALHRFLPTHPDKLVTKLSEAVEFVAGDRFTEVNAT